MKGDFSKRTFDPTKHFHNVLMQQGRVFLDPDWNEQAEIIAHRNETGVKDIIGDSGAPIDGAGFQVGPSAPMSPPSLDITISKGRFYVDGILCENDDDVLFEKQADYPLASLPTNPGNYLFYLDVWLFHATAVERSNLLEVALGGPDTTTRSKVIWQLKYAQAASNICPAVNLPDETAASTGKLAARSEQTKSSDNPCDLTATGGYRGLQNQLYRVEIHKGGTRKKATFKWAKNNASVVVTWLKLDNQNELTVSSLGKDELLGFNAGDWIELIDDSTDLLNKPGILAKISKPPQNNVITIDLGSVIFPDATVTSVSFNKALNPRARRWDSLADVALNTADSTWLDLEDGVQVNFLDGTFRTGDYWVIPARTAIADIEWQTDNANNPVALLPFGIRHHYAKLAILNLDAKNGWTVASDCRNLFPSLTELTALYYVGGDGQEAAPGAQLPFPLIAGVANGGVAVQNKKVLFEILPGQNLPAVTAGSLTYAGNGGPQSGTSVIAVTDENGLAKCTWTLDTETSDSDLQVQASLLDDAGNVIAHKLPVIFTANFIIASTGSKCSYTVGKGGNFIDFADAILTLLDNKITNVNICLLPGDHVIDADLTTTRNDTSFDTLKISGYGANIDMQTERIEFVATRLILNGFSLTTDPTRNTDQDSQIFLSADEIIIDHCNFLRAGPGDGQSPLAFITITKQSILYLSNSQIIGFFSLILADGVQGVIENNIISYILLQWQGGAMPPNIAGWNATQDGKEALVKNLQNPEQKLWDISPTWILSIRSNSLGIIVTNFPVMDPNVNPQPVPKVYRSLLISDNTFQLNFNIFVAQFLNFTNNNFITPPFDQASPAQNAFILGWDVVIIGNRAPALLGLFAAAPPSNINAVVAKRIAGGELIVPGNPAQTVSLVNSLNVLTVDVN